LITLRMRWCVGSRPQTQTMFSAVDIAVAAATSNPRIRANWRRLLFTIDESKPFVSGALQSRRAAARVRTRLIATECCSSSEANENAGTPDSAIGNARRSETVRAHHACPSAKMLGARPTVPQGSDGIFSPRRLTNRLCTRPKPAAAQRRGKWRRRTHSRGAGIIPQGADRRGPNQQLRMKR